MRENENQSEERNKKGRQANNPLVGLNDKSQTLRKASRQRVTRTTAQLDSQE